jgi:hypothetical protein
MTMKKETFPSVRVLKKREALFLMGASLGAVPKSEAQEVVHTIALESAAVYPDNSFREEGQKGSVVHLTSGIQSDQFSLELYGDYNTKKDAVVGAGLIGCVHSNKGQVQASLCMEQSFDTDINDGGLGSYAVIETEGVGTLIFGDANLFEGKEGGYMEFSPGALAIEYDTFLFDEPVTVSAKPFLGIDQEYNGYAYGTVNFDFIDEDLDVSARFFVHEVNDDIEVQSSLSLRKSF